MLLSLKILKAANPINKHFKMSNYENKHVIFSKMVAFFKMAVIKLPEIKYTQYCKCDKTRHFKLIRMKDFALLKCSQAHYITNTSYMLVCIRKILFQLINDGIQNGYQSWKVLTYYFSFILMSCFSKF